MNIILRLSFYFPLCKSTLPSNPRSNINSGNFYVTLQPELCPFGSWERGTGRVYNKGIARKIEKENK